MADNVRLVREKSNIKKAQIKLSRDAAEYATQFYHDDIDIYESMFLILLNRSNNTIGWVKISQGGVAGTIIDVKLIVKYAIDCLASAVLLVHNHPSGNLKPSEADRRITKKAKDALGYMDVTILDHIILTLDGYYSFADNGEI